MQAGGALKLQAQNQIPHLDIGRNQVMVMVALRTMHSSRRAASVLDDITCVHCMVTVCSKCAASPLLTFTVHPSAATYVNPELVASIGSMAICVPGFNSAGGSDPATSFGTCGSMWSCS